MKQAPAAESTTDIVFEDDRPPICFTSGKMCANCAKVFQTGGVRALRSFADAVARVRNARPPKKVSKDSVSREVDQFLRKLGMT